MIAGTSKKLRILAMTDVLRKLKFIAGEVNIITGASGTGK